MVWTAYSRKQSRVIAYVIGDEGVKTAYELYCRTKAKIGRIACICTDANSCYAEAFRRFGVSEPHLITKAETHRIESANSSIRDNLARFNRRSKRHSKSWEMLDITLNLFFHRQCIAV